MYTVILLVVGKNVFFSEQLISLKKLTAIHVKILKELYFNTKEYKKDNEMRIKEQQKMWMNKTLSVEQWATDIVAASIKISVIVPLGGESNLEKAAERLTNRREIAPRN